MSSLKYASPLWLKIQPSRVLSSFMLVLHVGAVVLVFVSAIGWVTQLFLMLLVLCSLLMFGALNSRIPTLNFIKRMFPRINELVWTDDDSWLLINEAGEEQRWRIVGPDEFDLGAGKLSMDSPMARSLLGKGLDDEVLVRSPSGEQVYYVTDISYSAG